MVNFRFKEGDKVRIVRVNATDDEWSTMGHLPNRFVIGKIETIEAAYRGHIIGEFYKIKGTNGGWYPGCYFESINEIHELW